MLVDCVLSPSLFFFFFRWWECLLLGDGARGEPNIFPLLALPGEAGLEQQLDFRLFSYHTTVVSVFSISLPFLTF